MRFALFLLALTISAQDYKLGPDSERHPEIPHGVTTKYSFGSSKIYPGTARDYWVYVPSQYDAAKPACLTVFQDGGGYASETGGWRVPLVFDNLIAQKAIPVSIAIFVNPGILPARTAAEQNRYNRSYEYDALGDRYARFLIEELIPEVARKYSISANPDDRALAGSSSGGIAAFVAAWERPDSFHRVASFIGSFTDLRGADYLPSLIRKMEPKPLRVFLQDGSADQNIYGGNWYLGNQAMYSALQFSGYESTLVVGTEGHNGKHGGAILPDAMRWLWKDYPKPVSKSTQGGNRNIIVAILDPGSEWETVSEGHRFTEGPAADRNGNVFFVDTNTGNGKIYRIDAVTSKVTVFKEDSGKASGLMFGPDGRLYAAQDGRKRIVAYSPEGVETVLAEGVASNDLAVTSKGAVYFSDPAGHQVWYVDPKGQKRVVNDNAELGFPNGVRLSPDESLLLVSNTFGRFVWSFQIAPDGSLMNGQPFYHLELPDAARVGFLRSNADGMTLDTEGFLYVATNMGIQVCDQAGRVNAIISKPSAASPTNVLLVGHDLYVTSADKVYRRRIRRSGYFPWMPFKPPQPQL